MMSDFITKPNWGKISDELMYTYIFIITVIFKSFPDFIQGLIFNFLTRLPNESCASGITGPTSLLAEKSLIKSGNFSHLTCLGLGIHLQ